MTIHLVGEQFGDYRLIRLIGRGGFADVYLGEHTRRQTLAAVKVLNTRLANDNVKSFLNEARSIRLRHPNIVRILDFGLEDDFPFLVMEYALNGSLRQRYPRGTRLPLGTVSIYVKQIAGALQYAHDEGVVHRDIKPDNMLLGRQKEILLSDFGIASIAHTTRSMHVEDQVGTINYMAPEQLQGKPRPASDQYALGVVVYEWICGERPFQGSFVEIYGQHLSAPPPSLREYVPTLSPAIEKVVMTTLAKDSHRRFPTISVFARAFEQACKPVSTGRQVNRRVFTPQSPLSKVFAVIPTNNSSLHAETRPNKRSPTAPNVDFRSDDNKPPLAHPKNSAFVAARATVSLPEEGSKTYTTKDAVILDNGKRLVSIFRKSDRVWPFAFLIMIVAMLIFGLTIALLGGFGLFVRFIPGIATTSTVTITPKSNDLANTFKILAVTGTPDPKMHEIAEHILAATSPTQSKTVTIAGRTFPGTRATGLLTFSNAGNFDQTINAVILKGHSGVPVSFNGPITVPAALPASTTVTGFAVNIGSAGNIGPLDISETCCATGITVKSEAFSGGQDPQPYSIVQLSDIDSAANALAASLTPDTQAALQKKLQLGEQVVPNTLQCNQSTFTANHAAGDYAPDVTVTVAITCKEGIYDQQAVQTMAANLLKAQVNKGLGPNYALTGNIVTGVTKTSVLDTRGTVALLVKAEGVWVYQFSDAVKQGFAKHIAKVSKQIAIRYLKAQPGISDVQIDFSSSNILSDVAQITLVLKPIAGATGFGGNTIASGSPVVPTGAITPTISPTPTKGLGGNKISETQIMLEFPFNVIGQFIYLLAISFI